MKTQNIVDMGEEICSSKHATMRPHETCHKCHSGTHRHSLWEMVSVKCSHQSWTRWECLIH